MSNSLASHNKTDGLRFAVEPFLTWAGGKRQLLTSLLEELPPDISHRLYVEPFLGAGTLFFGLRPGKSILADANKSLIEVYAFIKQDPSRVRRELVAISEAHSVEHYYAVRDSYNRDPTATPVRAARFLYLNKTCFNGIFRVNQRGHFNVPKGSKDKFAIPSEEDILLVSKALEGSRLLPYDYKKTLKNAKPHWFIYLDPPYPALTDTAYFDHYTVDRFGIHQQQLLADECVRLDKLGARFLLSNADVPAIRKLYKGFVMRGLPVRRFISCKGERTLVSELLIKNYR